MTKKREDESRMSEFFQIEFEKVRYEVLMNQSLNAFSHTCQSLMRALSWNLPIHIYDTYHHWQMLIGIIELTETLIGLILYHTHFHNWDFWILPQRYKR